jgi:hypothetical protein
VTDADLANTATDFNPTGYCMGQLRTANKRQKRAIAATQARKKAAEAPVAKKKPVKAAG